METLGIQSIPHLMIFKKGVLLVFSEAGNHALHRFERFGTTITTLEI